MGFGISRLVLYNQYMKIINSSRIWYGKYAYKAVLPIRCRARASIWLYDNGHQDYKIRSYRLTKTIILFLPNEKCLNDVCAEFAAVLMEKHLPVNDDVASYIMTNTHVEIRKQLLYKKFRHKVYFRFAWLYQSAISMKNFIEHQLKSRDDYVDGQDWYANFNTYQPVLYLAHDSDLMMLTMTVVPEDIIKITTIKLVSEI